MNGGENGCSGKQTLIRANKPKENDHEELSSIDSALVQSGDKLIVKTPGGGAWGS